MLRVNTDSIAIVNEAIPIYLTLLMIVVIPPMDTSLDVRFTNRRGITGECSLRLPLSKKWTPQAVFEYLESRALSYRIQLRACLRRPPFSSMR